MVMTAINKFQWKPQTVWTLVCVGCLALGMLVYITGQPAASRMDGQHLKYMVNTWRPAATDIGQSSLDEQTVQKLTAESELHPIYSRGTTLFVDKDGNIRVPPDKVLEQMNLPDVEALYNRYLESIQTVCHLPVHMGQLADGGYELCEDADVKPSNHCLVYSFGIRQDFSFDDELSHAYGCTIHSFDPGNDMKDHAHSPTVAFHALGLGDADEMRGKWRMRTFNSIKKELGHSNRDIELVKIDIEGGEWIAVPEMLASGAFKGVKQLLIEFHSYAQVSPPINYRNKKDYLRFLRIFRDLYEEGFRIFYYRRFSVFSGCLYTDAQNIARTGCHEIHMRRV